MTPQERQLLNELFDRLATLESAPRDPEAVSAISEGLKRAPNALYPLVQTVLVQDEALKHADAHIRELEDELGVEPEQTGRQPGFLDNMRDSLTGGRGSQGSVPTVRPGAAPPLSSAWGARAVQSTSYQPGQQSGGYPEQPGGYPAQQQGGFPMAQPGGYPAQQAGPQGGSFLGTAAASAAGMVGGSLLMNSLRGMMGGGHHGQGHSALNPGGQSGTPWGPNAGGSDLARQAGVGDIGRSGANASQGGDASQSSGLFDTAQNDAGADFVDDDGGDMDFDGGSDTA